MRRRTGRLAVLGVVLMLLASACQWRYVGSGTIATSCVEGTYRLTDVTLTQPLPSVFGPITVTDPHGTVSVTFEDGDWSGTADGAVSVEGETPFGHLSGDAYLSGEAGGGYVVDGNRILFTLDDISGSVRFVGTVGDYSINRSVSFSDSGLRPLVALLPDSTLRCDSGSVSLTFGATGLTLGFTEV